jgi:DnaJ like chaperone protein
VDHALSGAPMQWFGKALGGIIGLAAAGPIGSLIGVLLGHQVDQSVPLFGRTRLGSPQQISQLFFEVAFEVMGQVAKVDGRVSESEIRMARGIMDGLRLTQEQVREAIECFTRGKSPAYALNERLATLARQIGDRGVLAKTFMQIQMQAAIGAGPIGAEKRQLLWRVASSLGVSRAEVAQIEALVRAHFERGTGVNDAVALEEAYRVLGVASGASDDDVKTAYRRLMNQHHPDKLVARGLPKSMAGVAEQKTQEIRAAYERIKARRGLR